MEAFPQGPWVSRTLAAIVLILSAGLGAYATFAPPQQVNGQHPPLPSRPAPASADQEQFVPYWTTEPGWGSEIQLRNNQISRDLTVTVVLRTPSGTETNLPSITLKPHEAVVADVATALRLVAPQLIGSWGSVVLRYKAPSEASLFSMAMIRAVGKPIALHIDSTSLATSYQTGSREGIWWFPSDTTNDWLVLTNAKGIPPFPFAYPFMMQAEGDLRSR